MTQKKIGIIGLGKMGYRIAERLIENNYVPVATDFDSEVVKSIEKKGAIGADSIKELVDNLPAPRAILFSIPAGDGIDRTIEELIPYLSKGDIIIDSCNSFYKHSQRREKHLKEKKVHYIDVGVSGGISGARYGACLMIGGDREAFEQVRDVFETLSKEGSYKFLGKSSSGHLVKGYHNLVEYGYLQALAEGLTCINKISEKEGMEINLRDVCAIWNRGSIVESRVTKDAEYALQNNPLLLGVSGSVFGQTQEEMEHLVRVAKEYGVEVPSCESALNARIDSQHKPTLAGKIVNVIRNFFGGHEEWKQH